MSISNSQSTIQTKLIEICQAYPSIHTACFFSVQGIPLGTYSQHELSDGEKVRLAATTLASSSLATRTLNVLSSDSCKLIAIHADNGNAAISITEKFYLLIITDKSSDPKTIAQNITELFVHDSSF